MLPPPELNLLAVEQGSVTAPAGCGKTHLIAQALAAHGGPKPILVLTHTNAGVAALRDRLNRAGVRASAYRLSTIDGWSLRLLGMFPQRCGHDPAITQLANPRNDYPAIRRFAAAMLGGRHIHDVLQASYDRLIVDEYQDCTVPQHNIVCGIAASLRTCVLGDPMQAIFGFQEPVVGWQAVTHRFPAVADLTTPWRWINVGEEAFGRYLLACRAELLAGRQIDLSAAPANVQWVRLSGANDHELRLRAAATRPPGGNGKVLVIGDSRNPQGQRDIAGQTPGAVTVENVDMRDLVAFAAGLNLGSADVVRHVISFAGSVMTGVGEAHMIARIATLQGGRERRDPSDAERLALAFAAAPTYGLAADLLVEINRQGGVRAHRPAILRGALETLRICSGDGRVSPQDAAIRVREQSRMIGRPLATRTVGSTLLLKGLEADVSVVLDPAGMDAKHLYVAITRGSKQLVICSPGNLLPGA